MVNLAMARVVVAWVESTGADHPDRDEADSLAPVGMWQKLRAVFGQQRAVLADGLVAMKAETGRAL